MKLLEEMSAVIEKKRLLHFQQLVFDVDVDAEAEIMAGSAAPKSKVYWSKKALIIVVDFSNGGQKIYSALPPEISDHVLLDMIKRDMKREAPGSLKSNASDLNKALREKYGKAFRAVSSRDGGGQIWESPAIRVKIDKLHNEIYAEVAKQFPEVNRPVDTDRWREWYDKKNGLWDVLFKQKIYGAFRKCQYKPISVSVASSTLTKAKTGVKAYGFQFQRNHTTYKVVLTIPEVIAEIEAYYGR